MHQVFISYSRDQQAGQALAIELQQFLKRQQIKAYRDEDDIAPGERWSDSLQAAIESSPVMLWVISAKTHHSEWQEKEYHEARRLNRHIIPVKAEDINLPMLVNDQQAVNLFGEQKAAQTQFLLKKIEAELGIDRIKPLVKQALVAKNNESYGKAIEKWQEVLTLDPDHARAKDELQTLKALQQQQAQGQSILGELAKHHQAIAPVFTVVANVLNQAGRHPHHQTILDYSERFLQQELDGAAYIDLCKTLLARQDDQPANASTTNYEAFTQRLIRGEMVLFIGSDLAGEYQQAAMSEPELAKQLAASARFDDFQGNFSTIAEFYRFDMDYGENQLLEKLRESISQSGKDIQLYKHLAQIAEPLILVSAAWDNLLEQQFDASGKPYVELTSLIRPCDDHGVGHLVVRYSDREKPEIHHPTAEEISRFRWYEDGYSLIFKIRGTCTTEEHDYQRETLALAESDYFTFARHAEHMIPAYLTKRFRHKGFLFVGFSPKSWEERLLVNALLRRRKEAHIKDKPYTVGTSLDRLEASWWNSQQVQNRPMDIHKLDEHLEEALL